MGRKGTAAGASEPVRKSGRTVQGQDGPRRWDERQRLRIRQARLAMLERDNHQTDNTHMMKVQAHAEDEMVGAVPDAKKKKKRITLAEKTKNKTLDTILQEGASDLQTLYGATYFDIVSPAPVKAGLHLCSVCGFEAPYTCRVTGMRLCSKGCIKVHGQTHLKGQ
mmetsp:Transcript_46400/g.110561  ORF Transcript_46400/g.110561 Transcript_46400/m.110561 type:complete len:165 (+) Transcript_46400:114-608(+)